MSAFVEQDLNRDFLIRSYPDDRDKIEYGTGAAGRWLFEHKKQRVTCIEIGALGWCANVQAQDGTAGWAFRTDLLNAKRQISQLNLF